MGVPSRKPGTGSSTSCEEDKTGEKEEEKTLTARNDSGHGSPDWDINL